MIKKVTDHHALLPTLSAADAESETVPDSEMKILRLICSQLIYAVSPEHIYESTAITVAVPTLILPHWERKFLKWVGKNFS